MDSALTNDRSFCGNCGTSIASRFCTSCGAEFNPPPDHSANSGGWWDVVEDFIGKDRNGLLRVAYRIVRSPVSTGLQLARDTQYTGHLKFLTLTTGALLTLQFVVLPKVLSLLPGLPPQKENAAALYTISQTVIYPAVLLMIFLQYYAFGARSKTSRAPLEYYKLCVISVGFSSIVSITALLPAIVLAYFFSLSSNNFFTSVSNWSLVIILPIYLTFVYMQHWRYWELSRWWTALLLAVLSAIGLVIQTILSLVVAYLLGIPMDALTNP